MQPEKLVHHGFSIPLGFKSQRIITQGFEFWKQQFCFVVHHHFKYPFFRGFFSLEFTHSHNTAAPPQYKLLVILRFITHPSHIKLRELGQGLLALIGVEQIVVSLRIDSLREPHPIHCSLNSGGFSARIELIKVDGRLVFIGKIIIVIVVIAPLSLFGIPRIKS